MPHSIDPDGVGFLFGDIARLYRGAFEHEIGGSAIGVTPAEARVLAHMARCGAVRQNRLACLLGVTPMSLTGFLDRLEAADLVRRGPDPEDRRAKIVTLTDAAETAMAEVAQAAEATRARALDGLGEEDRARLGALALKVRDNLDAARAGRLAAEAQS